MKGSGGWRNEGRGCSGGESGRRGGFGHGGVALVSTTVGGVSFSSVVEGRANIALLWENKVTPKKAASGSLDVEGGCRELNDSRRRGNGTLAKREQKSPGLGRDWLEEPRRNMGLNVGPRSLSASLDSLYYNWKHSAWNVGVAGPGRLDSREHLMLSWKGRAERKEKRFPAICHARL